MASPTWPKGFHPEEFVESLISLLKIKTPAKSKIGFRLKPAAIIMFQGNLMKQNITALNTLLIVKMPILHKIMIMLARQYHLMSYRLVRQVKNFSSKLLKT